MNHAKYEAWKDEPFAGCENPDVPMGRWVLEHAPLRPTRILDVGCGTGLHTAWFNAQGIETHGITVNRDEIAKRKHDNVAFGDMCDIPFPAESFDFVFCLGSLEHTFSPFIALCEFNRVLRPDGMLFIDMPNIYNMEVMDERYWYHKMVLFPIQVRDLLIKSQFDLIKSRYSESIDKAMYTADSSAVYLARKKAGKIRWIGE
jgi:ubiquinone/menaquinone biosynthesis C-methylase UbiE